MGVASKEFDPVAGAALDFVTDDDRIAARMLADQVCEERQREKMRAIVLWVAKNTAVGVKDIMSRSHVQRIARARHLAMFIAHRAGVTIPQIGDYFSRDRASVYSALEGEKARRAALAGGDNG